MPDPRFANQYHGDPQMGPDGILYYPDGSFARPDGMIVNPPTDPQFSALGGGTAGMSAVDQYNTMVGNRDQRSTGVYSHGGQVNPHTPAVGPYGSSNPGRDQKEREIANRYGPYTGIPHPLGLRSDMVESSAGHGGQLLEDPQTGRKTGKVTDASSPHFGAEYDPNYYYYDDVAKLVRPLTSEMTPDETPPKTKDPSPFMPKEKDPSPFMPSQGSAQSQGTPQENAIRNAVIQPNTGGRGFPATGSTIPPTVQQPVLPSSYESGGNNTPQANQGVRVSASLNMPVEDFTLETGKDHLQKLYNKIHELQDQGLGGSAEVRALRKRFNEVNDHVNKLKSAAAKMPQDEVDRRAGLPDDDPEKVWPIPEYTGALLPDGTRSLNPLFPTTMPEAASRWEFEGMESYDYNDDGVLDQTEYELYQRREARVADLYGKVKSGEMTRHGGPPTALNTPDYLMPGYTIRGGRDTTGTRHQGDGGINPNAPRFLGDGTMGPSPHVGPAGHGGHGGHDPSNVVNMPIGDAASGMMSPPPASNNPIYGNSPLIAPPEYYQEQPLDLPGGPSLELGPYGMDREGSPYNPNDPNTPPAQQKKINDQALMLAQQISNGEAIYRSIMQNQMIPTAVRSALAQLDANGNGYLSKKELKEADSILGDIAGVIDRGNLPRGGFLERLRANREERRNNRGR